LGSLKVVNECVNLAGIDDSSTHVAHRLNQPCPLVTGEPVVTPNDLRPLVIPNLFDSSAYFTIYGDTLCQQYNISQFSRINRRMFDVETLSDQEFCELLLIRPN
jgi:hypothetical protein